MVFMALGHAHEEMIQGGLRPPPFSPISRRALLKAVTGVLSSAALGRAAHAAPVTPLTATPFTLGVASGILPQTAS
jgi:hypothetical protein